MGSIKSPADRLGRSLPADGQELLRGFDSDVNAIQKDADAKIAARQDALVRALQDLQEKYTKAGKLDEAIAIRDAIRALQAGRTSLVYYRSLSQVRIRR